MFEFEAQATFRLILCISKHLMQAQMLIFIADVPTFQSSLHFLYDGVHCFKNHWNMRGRKPGSGVLQFSWKGNGLLGMAAGVRVACFTLGTCVWGFVMLSHLPVY